MRYSQDLKQRVLQFIAAGGSKVEASRHFDVHRSTVFVWVKQPEDHQFKKPGPTGSYKLDRQALRQLIETQPELRLKEMAEKLGVSINTIRHALKQMGIVRKKTQRRASRNNTEEAKKIMSNTHNPPAVAMPSQ